MSPSELEALEHEVLEHLEAEEGHVEADIEAAAAQAGNDEEPERSPLRLALAMAFPALAAAVMAGGVFIGFEARLYAAVAALLGVGLAVAAARFRSPVAANLVIIGGLFGIGLVMVVPSGIGNVASVGRLASQASSSGDVLRPPVELTAGWQAILGWLLGIVGFAAAWVAVVVKKPSVGLLLPLPVAAIAGISVPDADQVASGLVVLVLFAVGLGILSGTQMGSDDTDSSGTPRTPGLPAGYEARRALRALPLLAVVTGALYLLAQSNFLFPEPAINPAEQPQKPKTVPLSQVEDRVLFTVDSQLSGPWRVGSLDIYDGTDWRLPAFSESRLNDVPRDGVVNRDLSPGVRATFTIAGLGGTVLPGLPNTVGVVAEGPKLAYDDRSGALRVAQGQVQAGLSYTVAAAALPNVEDLRNITEPHPADLDRFTEVPPAPPAVADLIDKAPKSSKWDTFDFLRTYVLTNVTATGTGSPKSIPPERMQDMIAGSKEGTPYEIVAAQALLARWAGIPSRIGYGFDGGEVAGEVGGDQPAGATEGTPGKLEVRPKHGASFPEVYFPRYGWLPVIGTPTKAKPTVGSDPATQRQDPNVLPSDDIQIGLFVPVFVPPKSPLPDQIRQAVMVAVPVALLLLLGYVTWPGVRKAWVRGRRRTAARTAGPRARIALTYAEWRDMGTDYGYRHDTDTPFMYLDRFVEDPEHTEFAWLVTRCLWGDLQGSLTAEHATMAEELARALRRRLAQAHPAPVRAIGVVSRLSLRHPYAPELTSFLRKPSRAERAEAAQARKEDDRAAVA
ncbi:MAG TPA: transglutaminase domain-containing protein [Acidimicrobiia bacterium]|nr:transglutaminase domain-containing protein [Acidimicrobiia bacterium]